MFRPAEIYMPIFEDAKPANVALSFLMLRSMLNGLVAANVHYLRANPQTPPLYSSGVRYRPENGTEKWLTIPYVQKQGFGDCEDLAAWRAAEWIVKARVPAYGDVRARQIGNVWRAHAIVRLPNGSIDDPSLKLGMKGID